MLTNCTLSRRFVAQRDKDRCWKVIWETPAGVAARRLPPLAGTAERWQDSVRPGKRPLQDVRRMIEHRFGGTHDRKEDRDRRHGTHSA